MVLSDRHLTRIIKLIKLMHWIFVGNSFLAIRTYGSFTMETILATAFGRVIDVQRGESDELTRAVDSIFRSVQEGRSFDGAALISLFSKFP